MINKRRYDIDWLRVFAIGMLLIYHIAIGFQPWGAFLRFLKNDESMIWIWTPLAMLNVWRIPLLFFVSGMGVYFSIQSRDWKSLIFERSKRILLPYIFGMLAIVPLHTFLWQSYYNQDIQYEISQGHLWFLGNIFAYVLLFSPLFFYLKNQQNSGFHKFIKKLFGHPIGLLVIIIPFIAEAEIVNPDSFEYYALNMHGFWLGLIAFLTGFLCVYSGQSFWDNVTKRRWILLIIAATLYGLRVIEGNFNAPYYLKALESNFWIFTIFGFGHKYLNKPSSILTYLSKTAYPVYILHMAFLYLGSWILFPLDMPAFIKFVLVTSFTFIACFAAYEYFIRRIKFVRPIFGLKI